MFKNETRINKLKEVQNVERKKVKEKNKKRKSKIKNIYIKLKASVNNFFISAVDGKGNVIVKESAGIGEFKGPKRVSYQASLYSGVRLAERLKKKLWKRKKEDKRLRVQIIVVLNSSMSKMMYGAIDGLSRVSDMRYAFVLNQVRKGHNGLRGPKIRRL